MLLQPLKAFVSTDVTFSPKIISLTEVKPLNHEPTVGQRMVIEAKLLQPLKA